MNNRVMEGNKFKETPMAESSSGITVSPFDYSVENHLNSMNTIHKLCTTSLSEEESFDAIELEQLSSRITFLREWKHFMYDPRTVRFSCDVEGQQGKYALGEVNLPQFSAANVPKTEGLSRDSCYGKTSSNDFVLYVGGHVWALDWCPSIRQWPDCHVKCEYLAVSAHPPGSSYHKIGAPLTGRGVVQIWCVVHAMKEEESPSVSKIQRKKTKQSAVKKDALSSKRPRGRPRKESLDDTQPLKKARGRPKMHKSVQRSSMDLDTEHESLPPLGIGAPLVSSCLALVETTMSMEEHTLVRGSDIDLDLGDSYREIQIDQAAYGQFGNGKDKKLLTSEKARGEPKKPRGRPKAQKNIQRSLVDLDMKNESVPPLGIGMSLASSPCLTLVETTMNMEEPTLVKGSDIDLDLGGSNRENQIDQAAYGQFDNGKDKKLLTCEKARGEPEKGIGRCKKQKNIQRSLCYLDTENESVPPLGIGTSLVSSPCLALVETTVSTEEHALVKGSDIDLDLGGSNRENQIDQATYGQFDNGKAKTLLTCKKAREEPKKGRGRSKKRETMKEYLDTMVTKNDSAISLAIDSSPVSSEFLALTEVTTGSDECALKGCDNDVLDPNKYHPVLQETSIPLYIGNDKKQLKSTKSSGRSRKQKNVKESFVDLGTEDKSVLALTDGTRSMGDNITPKSYNGHGGSYDSNIELQDGQATPAEIFNRLEKKLLTTKKKRLGAKKKKDMKEPLVDLDTEEEAFPSPPFTASPLCYAEDDVLLESKSKRGQRLRKQKDMKDFVVYPENVSKFVPDLATEGSQVSSHVPTLTEVTRSREECISAQTSDTDFGLETETLNSYRRRKKKKIRDKIKAKGCADGISPSAMDHYKNKESSVVNNGNFQDVITSIQAKNGSLEVSAGSFDPSSDVAFPRVFLCLAHNGKVAWDVKWRPPSVPDAVHMNFVGYLAVVLGNGSLEVWEVPSPRAIEVLYSSCKKESTDPRFLKLEPVFRCSKLISGDRHSIPLTVEWSSSSPHDLLLAGCHDGTVALWKFCSSGLSQDTRPLLCFSADTYPIRALAWAPDGSDEESANVVVTAGHGGVRFWDIRDPYRPLGELNPRRFIYSLDWLQDPRCIIMSFDDGTLRCLSLSKAASDVPVTGKPFVGTQQQGFHTYNCSSSPIWSVQTSRLTGQVAYCGADGSALHFQLTAKAVDKDSSRHRAPHFLCGSLIEENVALTVNTPLPNTPFLLKKSSNELGEPQSISSLLSDINQAKRAYDQTLDAEPLALCYGDPSSEIDYGDRLHASKAKTTSKMSRKKNSDPDSDPVDNSEKGQNQAVHSEIEVLPPKIVAMHRVRWNMNKGSERWICYGGAAGIVRCQEISPSVIGIP